MSSARILAGPDFNLLARVYALAGGVVMTDVNSLYPTTRLFDGFPGQDTRFNTAGATMDVDIDLNELPSGDFEATHVGGVPPGWTKSAGCTATRNTTNPDTGASCVQLEGTAGTDYLMKALTVRASEVRRLEFRARGQGGSPSAKVRIECPEAGLWYVSGAWQTTPGDAFSTTSTTYQSFTATYTVPTFDQCLTFAPTIRHYLMANTAGSGALYDNCYTWSAVDWASVHGHNLSPAVTATLRSGTTTARSTTQATFTLRRPTFYTLLAAAVATDRYWRVRFTPANPAGPIYLGELVLAQTTTLGKAPTYGIETAYFDPQVRSATELGEQRVYLKARDHFRRAGFRFRYGSLTQFRQARDYLMRQSRQGAHPMVFCHDDTDVDAAIFGRLDPDWAVQQGFVTSWDGGLVVREAPFPTQIP